MSILCVINIGNTRISAVSILIIFNLFISFIVGAKQGMAKTFIKVSHVCICLLFTILFHVVVFNSLLKLPVLQQLQQDAIFILSIFVTFIFFYIFIGVFYKIIHIKRLGKGFRKYWFLSGLINLFLTFFVLSVIIGIINYYENSFVTTILNQESEKELLFANIKILSFFISNVVTNSISNFISLYLNDLILDELISPFDIVIEKIKILIDKFIQIISTKI